MQSVKHVDLSPLFDTPDEEVKAAKKTAAKKTRVYAPDGYARQKRPRQLASTSELSLRTGIELKTATGSQLGPSFFDGIKALSHEAVVAAEASKGETPDQAQVTALVRSVFEDAMQRLERKAGQEPPTQAEIQAAVAEAVEARQQSNGSMGRVLAVGGGLFVLGSAFVAFASKALYNYLQGNAPGMVVPLQPLLNAVTGILMGMFSPTIMDYFHAKARALNYWLSTLFGGTTRPKEPMISEADRAELAVLYFRRQDVEGRMQDAQWLIGQYNLILGNELQAARTMLTDAMNDRTLEDRQIDLASAYDLIASALDWTHQIFYALRPDQEELFCRYIFPLMEAKLRKFAHRDRQGMYDEIMTRIRNKGASELAVMTYFDPLLRGMLGFQEEASHQLKARIPAATRTSVAKPEQPTREAP